MSKERKKSKPRLPPRMIVAGMTQTAMISAVAGYVAVRSVSGVKFPALQDGAKGHIPVNHNKESARPRFL